MVGEHAGGQGPVLGDLGVADRLDRVPVVRVPPGGGGVQRGQFGLRAAPQLQLQQVGEQLVVAEPGPPRIQRDHERVGLLELLQEPLPARASGEQVGQFAVHPVQYRGPQQQPPDLLRLPVEHLGQQVLRHRPLAAGELGREPVRVRMPGQRQRRQPQPRRPALGTVIQQPEGGAGQLYPGRFEQRPRLLAGEPQVGRADLGELPRQPQPVQAQPQVMAGGEDEPQPGGSAHDQQLQLAQRLGRAQLVQVIDHQPDPVVQRGEIGQQPFDDRPAVEIGRRHQGPDQLRPGAPSPAARRVPKARTAAGHAPRPAPVPTRPVPPGPPRRSRKRAGASSRFRAAPTPRSPAPPRRAARKAPGGNDSSRRAGAAGALALPAGGRPHDALLDRPRPHPTPPADRSRAAHESPCRVTPAHPAGDQAGQRSTKTKRKLDLR